MFAIKVQHSYEPSTFEAPDDFIVCVTSSRDAAERIAETYTPQGNYTRRSGEWDRPRGVVLGVNAATAARYEQYATYEDWLARSEDGQDVQYELWVAQGEGDEE